MSAQAPKPKRRKISTSSALLKPFKSPIRKPQATSDRTKSCVGPSSPTYLDSLQTGPTDECNRLEADKPPLAVTGAYLSTDRTAVPLALTSDATHPRSDGMSALRRQHAVLLSHFSSVRTDLDTVGQAFSIESSTRDAELAGLIEVWRSTSRQAAEVVYATVRDRVNGLGGARAWKQREMDKALNGWGRWDDGGKASNAECNEGNDNEETPNNGIDIRVEYADQTSRKEAGRGGVIEDEIDEDEVRCLKNMYLVKAC